MTKSFQYAHIMFQSRRSSVVELSARAKDSIHVLLNNKAEYHHSDLIIGLHCFSRDGTPLQYRLFCVIEETVVSKMSQMKPVDMLTLFTSYAVVGRKYPDFMNRVDLFFERSMANFRIPELIRIIWCYARLYHRPRCFDQMVDKIFTALSTKRKMTASSICQLLWALAILDELTIEVSIICLLNNI